MTNDWLRPIEQIAYVAGECVAVREAGFTEEALRFPRSEAGLVALCAFNGIKPEQAPRGWHYWPGAGMKACWERVIEALWERAAAAMKEESDRAWEAYRIAHDQATENGGFAMYGTIPFVPASGTLPRENTEECSRAKPSGPTAESGDAQPTPVSDPISNKGR